MSYVVCYGILAIVCVAIMLGRRRSDRLWREHLEEQRRLDREHYVRLRRIWAREER